MVIKGCNIIDIESGKILFHMDVLIKGDRIERIGRRLKGDNIIDGREKFLIPGLIDFHAHLGSSRKDLNRFLRAGVTTIRNMIGIEGFSFTRWLGGTRVFNHLKVRNDIRSGRLLGPDIITAGPLIDGKKSFFPSYIYNEVNTKEEAIDEVNRQYSLGYDFIKIYSALSREAFEGVMERAGELGIRVCGHVPHSIGLKEAIKAGLYVNEHLHGIYYPYRPDLDIRDSDLEDTVDFLKEKRAWICPTLIAWQRLGNKESCLYEKEEDFSSLTYREKMGMRLLNRMAIKLVKEKSLIPQYKMVNKLKKIVAQFKGSDRLLAGTDCSIPYVVPGSSLLKEMLMLRESGLTNHEALKTATINPAKALSLENEIGSIKEGYRADLLLLDENPLSDLKKLNLINTVIKRGVVVDL